MGQSEGVEFYSKYRKKTLKGFRQRKIVVFKIRLIFLKEHFVCCVGKKLRRALGQTGKLLMWSRWENHQGMT